MVISINISQNHAINCPFCQSYSAAKLRNKYRLEKKCYDYGTILRREQSILFLICNYYDNRFVRLHDLSNNCYIKKLYWNLVAHVNPVYQYNFIWTPF